ncbi:MAG: RHS repeat-associated core domain-containing protein [Acidobacteriota bacterium]
MIASYDYDFADRQESLSVDDGVNPAQPVATGASYRPSGPLEEVTLGNGLVETRGSDDRYYPLSISTGALFTWTYATDPVGNIAAITGGNLGDRSYGYQAPQDFLTNAVGPWGSLGWSYDRLGNRVSETRDTVTDTYSYTPNACSLPDRNCPGNTALLENIALGAGGSRDYSFGLAGHLEEVTAGAHQVLFDSDGEGRLSSLRRPAVNQAAEMLYDGRSFLLSATEIPAKNEIFRDGFETGGTGCWSAQVGSAGGTGGAGCFSNQGRRVRPIYDSEGTVHVLRARPDVNGTEESTFVFYLAGRPVAQLDQASSSWSFFTTDHLGTPILVTDDSGNLLWQGGFEPFGNDWQAGTVAGASENGVFLRLPGQWVDSAWGGASEGAKVFYNLYRWYENSTGRYAKVDPLGFEGGPNPYVYSRANPLASLDPTGLTSYRGFPPDKETAIKDAVKTVKEKLEDTCCVEDPDELLRKLETATLIYKPGLDGLCGRVGPIDFLRRRMKLGPITYEPGRCGPLECTVLHELIHLRTISENAAYKAEKDCFNCGTGAPPND